MTTSIARFPLPTGTARETIEQALQDVAPQFKTIPGLHRKYFLLSADGKTCGGVYLWASVAEARAFSEGPLRTMVREKFAVEADITYFDTPVVVDNLGSTN